MSQTPVSSAGVAESRPIKALRRHISGAGLTRCRTPVTVCNRLGHRGILISQRFHRTCNEKRGDLLSSAFSDLVLMPIQVVHASYLLRTAMSGDDMHSDLTPCRVRIRRHHVNGFKYGAFRLAGRSSCQFLSAPNASSSVHLPSRNHRNRTCGSTPRGS